MCRTAPLSGPSFIWTEQSCLHSALPRYDEHWDANCRDRLRGSLASTSRRAAPQRRPAAPGLSGGCRPTHTSRLRRSPSHGRRLWPYRRRLSPLLRGAAAARPRPGVPCRPGSHERRAAPGLHLPGARHRPGGPRSQGPGGKSAEVCLLPRSGGHAHRAHAFLSGYHSSYCPDDARGAHAPGTDVRTRPEGPVVDPDGHQGATGHLLTRAAGGFGAGAPSTLPRTRRPGPGIAPTCAATRDPCPRTCACSSTRSGAGPPPALVGSGPSTRWQQPDAAGCPWPTPASRCCDQARRTSGIAGEPAHQLQPLTECAAPGRHPIPARHRCHEHPGEPAAAQAGQPTARGGQPTGPAVRP
jgi:hypothetical protein